ncbi:hypothetical protein GCM10011369_32820 [Neiella marina]|uniref:Translesion DNA synthesis-associated protein ImuA n=1 Tax=Neiella marina TaxID=508461 RepID=A0A8J2U9B6_9GAMM|nr:translesion DNA synthesis-associated protein ImuA [Neiella marina]GGA88138.1 hypothetical protein GCM10011369_32820 [Neiella marina]
MSLQSLLNAGRLWRATNHQRVQQVLSSGIATLDQLLLGGWPKGQATELLYDGQGLGELRLLLPTLAQLSQQQIASSQWQLWLAPPFVPYPPALHDAGLNVSQQLLVQSNDVKQQLWAAEQALQSGSCSAVMAWLDSTQPLASKDIRRLQVAAEQGQSQLWLMRPSNVAAQSSPAACRLKLSAIDEQQIQVHCIKRRGGWAPQPMPIQVTAVYPSTDEITNSNQPTGQIIQGPWSGKPLAQQA